MTSASVNQIATLTQINLQDMFDNFDIRPDARGRGLFERIFTSPARLLAEQVAAFDRRVGEVGLAHAARELLLRYVRDLEIIGAENIPANGGVIFASNHPGMNDTLACFTSIPRDDLRVVSADRPFVRALPNIAAKMFWVSEQSSERLAVVRQIARYVCDGGAVLICPAGKIEPDPAVMPGALESLDTWSESLGMFVRLASNSVIIPTIVSGVVYEPALYNPVAQSRKTPRDRERAAATIQAALQTGGWTRRRLRTKIEFGKPLRATDLIRLGDARAITCAVIEAAKTIIARHSCELKFNGKH